MFREALRPTNYKYIGVGIHEFGEQVATWNVMANVNTGASTIGDQCGKRGRGSINSPSGKGRGFHRLSDRVGENRMDVVRERICRFSGCGGDWRRYLRTNNTLSG